MIAKYLAMSFATLKVVKAPRVMIICFPTSTISKQLGGVAIQIHHVARLFGGLGAAVHGHGHIGLGQRRRVIGAVAGHGEKPTLALVFPDQA